MRAQSHIKHGWVFSRLISRRIGIAAGLLGILASGVLADTVLYNFNSGTTLGTALTSTYTGTKVSEQSTGGLDNSGSINFMSGDGNQAWFSKNSYSNLQQGETLSVSLYFKFDAHSTSSIKMGFATDNTSSVDETAMTESGESAFLGVWNTGYELYHRTNKNGGYIGDSNNFVSYYSNDNWYYIKLSFTLANSSTSTFNYSWQLNQSSDTGVLGNSLMTGSNSMALAGMNTALYVYLGMENPTSTASYAAIDNLTMFSQGDITPEPATIALLAAGGVILLRRKSKK